MIDRIRAETDLRQLRLLAGVTSSEQFENVTKALQAELGRTFEFDEAAKFEVEIDPNTGLDKNFDREGLQALKNSL